MKKMKKRVISLSLAMGMVLALAACGGSGDTDTSGSGSSSDASADDGEIAHLVMSFRTNGTVPSEDNIHRIEDAINEITREKIGAEIELMIIDSGSYKQQMTLILSGDEQLDIMGANAALIPQSVAAEQLRDLQPLLEEYGQDILSLVSEKTLQCGYFDGTMYCLPVVCDTACGYGYYSMNKEIVDKYNIDVDAIKTYDDLTEVFQLVHDNEPDINIVASATAGYSPMQYNVQWDKLGNYFGVLDNYGQDDLTVVNLFETDAYREYLEVMRDWYERGFISNDISSSTESGAAQVKAGTLFAYANANKPGIDAQEQQNSGVEMTGAQVLETFTISGNNWQWTIPENSAYPEKAMQFLNLLYSDSDILNLIVYGQEGEDYVVHDDGRIGYPDGIDATSVGYSCANMLWSFGYEFNAHVWETNEADVWDQTKEWNTTGLVSKAYGFVFNNTPVANEVAAVQNVYDQYRMSLECGLVDIDEALTQMNEEMYAAGLQTIIDEKQRQLDEWAASK